MADFIYSRRGDKARFIIEKGTDDERAVVVSGRVRWALESLIRAGVRGITSLENPGTRLSHYVLVLRRKGVLIDTAIEAHGGAFAGQHGRYILRSRVVAAGAGEGV